MQDPKEIEKHYQKKDPWGYQTSSEDTKRKGIILDRLEKYGPFLRALDIGCGEGWITKDLPAKEIFGFELSDTAASRFPDNVTRELSPTGGYDLVIATGIFYPHYDWQLFMRLIKKHASQIFLTSNIKSWELEALNEFKPFKIHDETFPYNEHEQHLQIFDFGAKR